jgi:hypothetical protein
LEKHEKFFFKKFWPTPLIGTREDKDLEERAGEDLMKM